MGFEQTLRDIAYPLARFATFAANGLIFGLVPILLLVLRPVFQGLPVEEWRGGRERAAVRIEGFVQASLITAFFATVVAVLLQATLVADLRAEDMGLNAIESVFETTFGRWYALRIPVLGAAAIVLWRRVENWALAGTAENEARPGPFFWVSWMGLGLALMATATFSGHSTVAEPRLGAEINDLIHQASGAIWFAGIIVLSAVVPDAWRGKEHKERLALLTPSVVRFSTVALITITVAGITGLLNSLLHVGSPDDLIDTGYGRTLFGKIALFGGILLLGGINHFYVRSKLESGGAQVEHERLFRRLIAVELTIAICILALTGLLTNLARTK